MKKILFILGALFFLNVSASPPVSVDITDTEKIHQTHQTDLSPVSPGEIGISLEVPTMEYRYSCITFFEWGEMILNVPIERTGPAPSVERSPWIFPNHLLKNPMPPRLLAHSPRIHYPFLS